MAKLIKALAAKLGRPAFHSGSHLERRELTSSSCLLASTCTPTHKPNAILK